MYFDAANDWLVVTPDGYFDGSERGRSFVSYRVDGKLVPAESYPGMYRPGLLATILKGKQP